MKEEGKGILDSGIDLSLMRRSVKRQAVRSDL